MFAEFLDGAKEDILASVAMQTFNKSETEGAQAQAHEVVNTHTAVSTKIDTLNPGEGSSNDSLESLAEEFSVTEKTASAIAPNLAEIVKSLLSEKLAADKLAKVQNK